MHFEKKGDVERGHKHTYDHGTLVSSGGVLVEVLSDDSKTVLESKEYKAPTFIFIKKDNIHRLTALEDNTVCACIHAIKTMDDEIVDPDFLVETLKSENKGELRLEVIKKYNKEMMGFTE
jgi:quercetin dioxygenase-like cupin family protein